MKIADALEAIPLLILIEKRLKVVEEFFFWVIENIVVVFSSPPKLKEKRLFDSS